VGAGPQGCANPGLGDGSPLGLGGLMRLNEGCDAAAFTFGLLALSGDFFDDDAAAVGGPESDADLNAGKKGLPGSL
jgi:hypothetical protein